ncbi:membrane dipeptidase [Lentzea aerocolonigenes]|uniref:membrane dipeptidase n=1 Tax=Lentzea aerocolonigenes TaxID=68170 RepID=UPI000A64A473|nr:membrane dipeptidase [Lentzea aerocolonigenes]MCP2249564.1 Membrane dipeptidase (Peptidase family M19) [Lentzea aerocolonigenes]
MLLRLALAVSLVIASISPAAADTPWWEPVARPAPDSQINVTGEPFKGTDGQGRVRGFVDAHNHLMTNEGFGGRLICGKPFSEQGIADALKDCPEHHPLGLGAIFEAIVTGDFDGHDPVGWPTFKDWPSSTTVSHQQNYYAWLERAWRGGQRVLVQDLTSNATLCIIHPFKDRSCDEMTSIRLQAQRTYELQAFIDKQFGGTGKGWFRIVTSAEQARDVVAQGKLAVVLGIETSELFGCRTFLDFPLCNKADIDRGLDEMYALGVRSAFLCHKFDNALCGVRFDSGTQGGVINAGQFLRTGQWWQTEACKGPQQDNPIGTVGPNALIPATVVAPAYDPAKRCNVRGLTSLGEYAVQAMMKRHMMIEIDHMSVKAAGRTLELAAQKRYPGIVSSHSWMDAQWTEQVYQLGGFVAGYENDPGGYVAQAAAAEPLRRKYDVGIGFGSDYNGVGSHPAPQTGVTYPFRSYPGGPLVDRQRTGERVWDINVDGGAHIGLLPDWVEKVRQLGGDQLVQDMLGGAESYLRTWSGTQRWTS